MEIYNLLIFDTSEHFIQDVRNVLRILRTEDILAKKIIIDFKLGHHNCNCSPFSKEFERIVNIAYEDKSKGSFIILYFDKNTSGIESFKYCFDTQQSALTINSTTLNHFVEFDSVSEERGLVCSAKEKDYFSLISYKSDNWKKLTIEERLELLTLFKSELSEITTYKAEIRDNGEIAGRKARYIKARNKLLTKPKLKKQAFELIRLSNTSVVQWFGVLPALRTLSFSAKN